MSVQGREEVWTCCCASQPAVARVWLHKARPALPKCSGFAEVEGSFLHFLTIPVKENISLQLHCQPPTLRGLYSAQQWTFWIWVSPSQRRASGCSIVKPAASHVRGTQCTCCRQLKADVCVTIHYSELFQFKLTDIYRRSSMWTQKMSILSNSILALK